MWLFGFWVFPIISACMWLATLLALFIRWEVEGHPHLPSMEAGQKIAYISDTGAYGLKPLFIAGCAVTTIFLDIGFIGERWLRHIGRLAPNTSASQKILSALAIIFALAGSAGLILLSIFDTYHHPKLHDGFLLLFIAGFIISAIFICAEYQRLGIHYRDHRILRVSFWVKLIFILVEFAFAVVFVGTGWTHHKNVAAIFEWIVALVFTFYILSFVIDLLPSVRTKNHVPQGFKEGPAIEKGEEHNFTNDSAGPTDNVNGGYRGTASNGANYTTNGTTNGTNGVKRNGATNGSTRKKEPGRFHFHR